jgi:hypothetical protein
MREEQGSTSHCHVIKEAQTISLLLRPVANAGVREVRGPLDIRAYDMQAAPLHAEQGYLSLHVPGLSENRPSVLCGDAVMARPPWENGTAYTGYAHRIEMEPVLLKFSRDLHQSFVDGMKFASNSPPNAGTEGGGRLG